MKWNLPDCRLRWFLSCKVLLKALIAIKIFIQDRPVPIGRSSRTTDHRPEVGNAFLHVALTVKTRSVRLLVAINGVSIFVTAVGTPALVWRSSIATQAHSLNFPVERPRGVCEKTHSPALMNELNAHHFFFTQNPPPFMVIRLQS